MRKILFLQLAFMLSLCVAAEPTFSTRQVPVNRGGQDDGTVSLRFYSDMPEVPYISISDFQQLMYPGTTVSVSKRGDGEYLLKRDRAEATVNTSSEQFTSDDYMGFTNLMGLVQPGMDNVYLDGAPFVRYRSLELTPTKTTLTFDFKKYGIDLRGDEVAVYFPLATLSDLYSDLYYHIAGYNGERVVVVTDNQYSNFAQLDPAGTKKVLQSKSRSADMAAYSYGELCFVIDHFYGMPGRSPLEGDICSKGIDKTLDTVKNGPTIKKLLKSTNMQEYLFGMNLLQMLMEDGGHTGLVPNILCWQVLIAQGLATSEDLLGGLSGMMDAYPDLLDELNQYFQKIMFAPPSKDKMIKIIAARPSSDTYYKEGDTAYLFYNQFGMTNNAAWKAYYDSGCTGSTPAIDENFKGDLSVVLDALKRANDDPEVKNLVIDISANRGGSLDLVMAMTALTTGQSQFYSENVLTGQRQTISYDFDYGFDGKFSGRDKSVKYDLNFAVLTSSLCFSCGNLLPSLMKGLGVPVFGERSGGGACAVQQFATPEGLQYQLSSARARLTDANWQNIDSGVEPTYTIDTSNDNYAAFYDVPTISSIIKKDAAEKSEQGTGIATVTAAADGKWHTLDGRRLAGRPTKKGVYIRNGKTCEVKRLQ